MKPDTARGQSAAHAGRHTLRVEDLDHVEDILRTRTGSSGLPRTRSGDSRPSTQANRRPARRLRRGAIQRPMSSQPEGSAAETSRRTASRSRGSRVGGRRARHQRGANRSEEGGSPIILSDDGDDDATEQPSGEPSGGAGRAPSTEL